MARCGECKIKVTGSTLFTHPCNSESRQGWAKIIELKKMGNGASADRLAKKLMGIEPDPMSEEDKETMRLYREEHREELRQKAKNKRLQARVLKERLTPKLRKFL